MDNHTTQNPAEIRDFFIGLSPVEWVTFVRENPSWISTTKGAMAEWVEHRQAMCADTVRDLGKPRDSDRDKKFDRAMDLDGYLVRKEVKSVKKGSVTVHDDGTITAQAVVHGSDRTDRVLPDGTSVHTTLLPYGTSDILAVNCEPIFGEPRFAYARNDDLIHSSHPKYSATEQRQLIKSEQPIRIVDGEFDPDGIFHADWEPLVRDLIAEGALAEVDDADETLAPA